MMNSFNDTQRIHINALSEHKQKSNSGPGCLLWGILGIFGILIAFIIVGFATFSGWNEGINLAHLNATNVRAALIATQCGWIARDIESNTTNLLELRFDELLAENPVPDCVVLHAPTATALHIANIATSTSQPTVISNQIVAVSPTLVPTTNQSIGVQTTSEPTTAQSIPPTDSNPGYNLDSLLQEAEQFITANEWTEATDTLEAVIAVDPNYQTQTIQGLMLEALTSHARALYRNNQLAEAILLTDRAEQYGDVGDLNYERFIAGTYLEAQRLAGFNYQEAIRLLRSIVVEQGLANYQNGAASRLLFDQYVAYGDALGLGGSHCNAVGQYNIALTLRLDNGVQAKANTSQVFCNQASNPPSQGFAPSVGGGQPQPTYAPVGQVGN